MYALDKRRTLQIWIVILAVLFSALAPTLSHALVSSHDSYPGEICTTTGYKAVTIPVADTKKSPASVGHGMEHCAFCATHGRSVGLLSSSSLPFAIAGGHDLYPPLFYTAPATLHFWIPANPRAPPSFV